MGEKTEEEGKSKIKFGKLFNIYNGINDKCVGLLLRARKKHLLTFEGEMLFQRRDDDKIIAFTKTMNSIRYYFGLPPDTVGGGVVDHEDPDIIKVVAERKAEEEANNNQAEKKQEEAIQVQEDENTLNVVTRKHSRRKSVMHTLTHLRKRSQRKKHEKDEDEERPESPENREGQKKSVVQKIVNLGRKNSLAFRRKKSQSPACSSDSETKKSEIEVTLNPGTSSSAPEPLPAPPAPATAAKKRWMKLKNVSMALGSSFKQSQADAPARKEEEIRKDDEH